MKLSRQTKVVLGFAGAFVLLAGVQAANWLSTLALGARAAEDTHTQEVLTRLSSLLAAVNDVERGQRGYVITSDEVFVQAHQQGEREAAADLAALRELGADDPVQQQVLDTLESLVSARLAFARSNIELRRTDGFETARRQIATLEGKEIHDAVRRVIAEMEQHETARLALRETETLTALRRTLALISAAGVLSLLLMGTALVVSRRDLAARRHAEERISELNRLYVVLSEINQLIVRERQPQAILEGACRIAVEKGGFPLAWVSQVDPATGRLQPVAQAGDTPGAPAALMPIFHEPQLGCAFGAQALATGRHAVCDDIARCPLRQPCCEAALEHGYRAMASLPLIVSGRFKGVFSLCAREIGTFDADEQRLLDELAVDIAFGLEGSERNLERDRALEQARASEERFRELAETIDDVFWVTDAAMERVLYVSPAYEHIWGLSCQSLYESSQAWLRAVHPDDHERVHQAATSRLARGEFDEQYRIVRPDGTVRWIQNQAFPVRNPDGHVERVVGTARDITDQRILEEQFRQAQKLEAIGQLAGGVAHDFNNMLTVILGYSEVMRGELPDPLQADCDEVIKAARRAQVLTQQLLAFSRRQALKLEPVSVNAILEDAGNMLRRLLGENIELVVSLAPDVGTISADRGQLEQVVVNLAVNARDAMPEGGTLVLEVRNDDFVTPVLHEGIRMAPGRYVALTVADTGIGMDAHTKGHLFEPFFTTKAHGKGTGLGLATVYGIVKQSGGYIWVYSEPGKGSTFKLYFPRIDEPPVAAPLLNSSGTVAGAGERILLVEDEDAVRGVMRRILSENGYEVIEAGSGEQAMELASLTDAHLDLLITDVVLPGMSGPALAERLMAARPAMKVLYASGYVPETARQFSSLDPRAVLQKPLTEEKLLRGIGAVLGKSL